MGKFKQLVEECTTLNWGVFRKSLASLSNSLPHRKGYGGTGSCLAVVARETGLGRLISNPGALLLGSAPGLMVLSRIAN